MSRWELQSTFRDIKNQLDQVASHIKSADFSHIALLNARGELIHVEGPHPLHYFGFTQTIPSVTKYFKLGPDELIVTSDPAFGSPRLCDINFVKALYRGKEIAGYGVVQISLEDLLFKKNQFEAKSLDDEGYKIPPTPLDPGGAIKAALFGFLSESMIDSKNLEKAFSEAELAINKLSGVLGELEKRWGRGLVNEKITKLQDYTEELLKKSLHRFPDGEFTAQIKVGDGNLQTKLRVKETAFTVDFSGTTRASRLPLNILTHVVLSSCFWFFLSLLEEDIPLNNGVLKAISVETPIGTLVNPPSTSPCLDGYYQTSQMVFANLKSILKQALPHEAEACRVGPSLTLGIKFPEKIFIANYGLGTDAEDKGNGVNCIKTDFHNTPVLSTEIIENRYPLEVVLSAFRISGIKKGQSSGQNPGRGLSQTYKILKDGKLKVLSGLYRGKQDVVITREDKDIHIALAQLIDIHKGDLVKVSTFNGHQNQLEDDEG